MPWVLLAGACSHSTHSPSLLLRVCFRHYPAVSWSSLFFKAQNLDPAAWNIHERLQETEMGVSQKICRTPTPASVTSTNITGISGTKGAWAGFEVNWIRPDVPQICGTTVVSD